MTVHAKFFIKKYPLKRARSSSNGTAETLLTNLIIAIKISLNLLINDYFRNEISCNK